MKVINFFAFNACLFIFTFGLHTLFFNKKSHISRIFFLFTAFISLWNFGINQLSDANTLISAIFWVKFSFFFLVPASSLYLHFVLLLTDNTKFLKKNIHYFVYLFSFILILFILNDIMKITPYLDDKRVIGLKMNLMFIILISLNMLINYFIGSILIIRWGSSLPNLLKKKQTIIIALTLIIPLLSIIILCFFFYPDYFIELSKFVQFISLIAIFGFGYTLYFYKLLTITPKSVIDEILYNMKDMIIFIDIKGTIKYVNQQIVKQSGYSLDNLINKPLSTIMDIDLSRLDDESDAIRVLNKTVNLMTQTGYKIPIEVIPFTIMEQKKLQLGYMLICHDLTKQLLLEKEINENIIINNSLIQKEIQYKYTINALSDLIHVVDHNLKIILYNNACQMFASNYFKDSKTVLDGLNLSELFPFLPENVYAEYQQVFETGKQLASEESMIINNREYDTETIKIPIIENGQVTKIVTVIKDITEQKKNQQIATRYEKIKSTALLASGIAHDFNNFLTGILGNIYLAKCYLNNEEQLIKMLQLAENATLHAKNLSYQLLNFSRGGEPVKKTGSISTIIQESASFCLSGGKINFKLDYPPDLWPLAFDEDQIANVFQNLFLNAKEAIPDGGQVHVSVSNLYINANQLPRLSQGNYLYISIEDNGPGIKKEYLNRIFDPFFTTKNKGSGLGLASCFSIITKHNGYIEVESEENCFTRFKLYLPSSHDPINPKFETLSKTPNKIIKKKILFLDDDENVLTIAKNILEYQGHEVVLVNTGEKALELYQNTFNQEIRFDLVILDLAIKGSRLGGKDILKKMMKINPQIKALACSGYSNDPVMIDYCKYGFQGIIKKPFQAADLEKAINML